MSEKVEQKSRKYIRIEKESQWELINGLLEIDEYKKDVTNPDIVKAAVGVLTQKDELEEAQEKKNKDLRAKSKKKKNDFDDDDDLD